MPRANMRIAATFALILLLPLAACGQPQPVSATGHFEDWPSGARWGTDQQTFDVKMGTRRVDAAFTVATNGFGWRWSFTGGDETFNRWTDITAWCWAPGTVSFRTQRNRPMAAYGLEPEVLATIVEAYFKQHASEVEWSGQDWTCTPQALGGQHPARISKVRELLEAAASDEP